MVYSYQISLNVAPRDYQAVSTKCRNMRVSGAYLSHGLIQLYTHRTSHCSQHAICDFLVFVVKTRTSKLEMSKTGGGPPDILTKDWEKKLWLHCKLDVKGSGIPDVPEPASKIFI